MAAAICRPVSGSAAAFAGMAAGWQVQPTELAFQWDTATGIGGAGSYFGVFCVPSYYEGSLDLTAGGTLTGSCARDDGRTSSTVAGTVVLPGVLNETGEYGATFNLQMEAVSTDLEGMVQRFSAVVAEGNWVSELGGEPGVPRFGGGLASYRYTCEDAGGGSCPIGPEIEGAVWVSLLFGLPVSPPVGASCIPGGAVIDAFGMPVSGVLVTLRAGDGFTVAVATDEQGRYDFGQVGDGLTPGFDSSRDRLQVTLTLEEAAHQPHRYVVYGEGALASLATSFLMADRPDCRLDFDFRQEVPATWGSAQPNWYWPALVQFYQGIGRAWALADLLGQELTYGLPLKIHAFCTDAQLGCDGRGEDFAFAVGKTSDHPGASVRPYLAFGRETSSLDSAGWPDNREYHEFGHYFLAAAFDGMPARREDDPNHWGYKNSTSTDSWIEGFAEFYSAMVSRHIDRRPDYPIYRVNSSWRVNLLSAQVAWELEEMAVASLLTSLEAGPEMVESVPLRVTGHATVIDPRFGPLLVGSVVNDGNRIARGVRVQVGDLAGTWVRFGSAIPGDVGPGMRAAFVFPVPQELPPEELAVVAREVWVTRAAPFQVGLRELWEVMRGFQSTKPGGNGHLFDVEDLYQALRARWGGGALTAGLDGVDQLFVRHGFYDNSAHTDPAAFTFELGDAIGVTSHRGFGATELAGEACRGLLFCSPERSPRTDLEPPPASEVAVDSGGVPAAVYVQVDYPGDDAGLSYGTVGAVSREGTVAVPFPPAGSGATVTLIALADGRTPQVLAVLGSADLWAGATASGGQPFLSFTAELAPGDFEIPDLSPAPGLQGIEAAAGLEGSGGPGLSAGEAAVVLILLVAALGAAGVTILRLRRRSR